jgi:hypothetical protein
MNIDSEFKAEWVTEKKRVNLSLEGEIRRMRLTVSHFVYNPKFGYKVELGFSRDIGTVVVGNSGNVILDGVLYKPTLPHNWFWTD